MRMRVVLWTLCFAYSAVWAQQAKAPPTAAPGGIVEVADEPHHHQVLQNQYVRAFGVALEPHQSMLMHRHANDYLSFAFGRSEVNVTSAEGTVTHVVFEDGDVHYSAGGVVHAVTNLSDVTFRNWTIELLQNQGSPVCMNHCESDPRAKDWPPSSEDSKLLGYGDTFRISLTTLKAKQTVSTEEPFSHLVLMLTDMHGHVGPEGSAGSDFTQKRGDIMFHDSHPNHGLTNSGDQDARMIVVEFK